MRTRHCIAACTALAAFALVSLPASAGAITERQKRNCRVDYQKFCKDYGLGTEGLRACMSRSVKKLSSPCVGALVDAGEMTKAQADKLRKTPAKKTTSKKTSSKKTASKKTSKKRTTQKRGSWNPFRQP